MKKLFASALAMAMAVSMGSVAFAADTTDKVHEFHGQVPPHTSSQDVSITINGFKDPGEDGGLPSEYHVRVIWDVENGVYDVSQAIKKGLKIYNWDCVKLDYVKGANISDEKNSENWITKPKVAFEVTNASTPNLDITAMPRLGGGTDNWKQYMKADYIGDQNNRIGIKTIKPVLKSKLGSGVDSRVDGTGAFGTQEANVYQYTYELNWDYEKLNEKAYDLWKTGATSSETVTNTYAVAIGTALIPVTTPSVPAN